MSNSRLFHNNVKPSLMPSFKKALSKVTLNVILLSVHVAPNFATQWAIFFPPLKQKLINSIFTSYFCLLYKIESGKVTSCYWHCFISFVKFFGCINNGLVVLYWPKWFNCWKVKHFKTHLLIYKFQYWNNSFRQRLTEHRGAAIINLALEECL